MLLLTISSHRGTSTKHVFSAAAADLQTAGHLAVGRVCAANRADERPGGGAAGSAADWADDLAGSELFGHKKHAFTGAEKDHPGIFGDKSADDVLLDEIGDMPLNQQAKLLRVLQERKVQRVGSLDEKKVNFRSISATRFPSVETSMPR